MESNLPVGRGDKNNLSSYSYMRGGKPGHVETIISDTNFKTMIMFTVRFCVRVFARWLVSSWDHQIFLLNRTTLLSNHNLDHNLPTIWWRPNSLWDSITLRRDRSWISSHRLLANEFRWNRIPPVVGSRYYVCCGDERGGWWSQCYKRSNIVKSCLIATAILGSVTL